MLKTVCSGADQGPAEGRNCKPVHPPFREKIFVVTAGSTNAGGGGYPFPLLLTEGLAISNP